MDNRGRDQENPRAGGLEPLGNILGRRLRPPGGPSPSLEAGQERPNQKIETGTCVCQTCGKNFQGEVVTFYFMEPPREIRANECPECREKSEADEKNAAEKERRLRVVALREHWLDTCGIPPVFRNTRFKDLDSGYQAKGQNVCRRWARSFVLEDPTSSRSLVLYSDTPGVGKSVLTSCIGGQVIDEWDGDPNRTRCPVIFHSGPDLVRRIRATFDVSDGQYHEREVDIYKQLARVRLLMLDDVGKEQPRSYRFTQEMYWYIIDARVKAGLPVVINSRRPLTGEDSLEELMGVDTVDRLYGMTGGGVIELTGPSYRKLKRIP